MRLIIATLTAALAAAAAADASTVAVVKQRGFLHLQYIAAPGETNHLTVTLNSTGGGAGVEDPTATVTAGEGCSRFNEHIAMCGPPEDDAILYVDAALGDGDDTAVSHGGGTTWTVDGGLGADTITGSTNYGDTLDGGPGADHLIGGTSGATFADADSDPDVIESTTGGTLDDSAHTDPLTIDMAAGTAGSDTFKGLTGAIGGSGDDALIAGSGTGSLEGGPGDDAFDGTKGPQGGTVHDSNTLSYYGGEGTDTYTCGHGVFEYVNAPDTSETIRPGCNLIRGVDWTVKPLPVSYTKTAVKHNLPCPDGNDDEQYLPCTATLTLTVPGTKTVLGTATFTLPRDAGAKALTVPLTKRGRRMLKHHQRATAALTGTDNHGRSTPLRWSFRLGDVRD
jgi:Ca2+-binding RTX toxin-like protein